MTKVLDHVEVGRRIELTSPITVTKAQALPYGQVEFIISNASTDRYGESVIMEGIDTSQYMKNPVVLWGHDYAALPLGRTLSLRKDGGNLIAKVEFDTDIYDFADTVYKQILRGTISAASIGGLVKAYGLTEENTTNWDVIQELELVEWSVVPVPANPEALVLSKAFEMKDDELKQQYADFVSRAIISEKGIDTSELSQQIETLENLLSALKSAAAPKSQSGVRVTGEEKSNNSRIVRYRLSTARTIAKSMDQQIERITSCISSQMRGIHNDTTRTNNP